MNARGEAIELTDIDQPLDFDAIFQAHYERIARVIVRVVRHPARAEEIAVEVFWKFWRTCKPAESDRAGGWLYRTGVRMALDELRIEARRSRRESETGTRPVDTPEQLHSAHQERDRVRLVLASLDSRQAELLLLRADGLSYAEIASAMEMNPSSVGALLSRAQQAFRKEYVKQYGEPQYDR